MGDAGPSSDDGAGDGGEESATADVGVGRDETGTGRYLYCVVRPGSEADVETGERLGEAGVDGAAPHLVVAADLAAVVQPRAAPYRAGEESTVRRWLLQHQGVVDAADDRFGTPLPVRFDTILAGDDDAVADWLRQEADSLRPPLERFAERSEYRVELTCDADAFGDGVAADDDRLSELAAEREAADEGTAFLKAKQEAKRERELVAERWRETTRTVGEALADRAVEVRDLDRDAATLGERAGDADFTASFAALADEDAAGAIGERLDDVAARPGVEVRYTGPWPPYTFAPTLGADE